jgi:hypothetical protein
MVNVLTGNPPGPGFTAVQAIVLDPNSVPYANGTWTANFIDPGTPGKTPLINASIITRVYAGDLDSFGFFTVNLPDNNIIGAQSGALNTKWLFTFVAASNPVGVGQPPAFDILLTISGAFNDISIAVQAAAAPFPGGGGGSATLGGNNVFTGHNTFTGTTTLENIGLHAVTGTVNSVNKVFTLGITPVANQFVLMFLNGLVQNPGGGNDYTLSGNTVTFTVAPITSSIVLALY